MKSHLLILGWAYVVTCGLALAFGLTLCVSLGLDTSAQSQKTLQFVGPLFLIVACLGLVPGLVGGIGLLRFRPWARALLLLTSAILLPMLPVGTVIGIYGFWTLLNPQTQALLSGAEPAANALYLPAPSPLLNLFGVMACVAAGFFLVIKVGFIVNHQPQPAPIESNALTATAALVLIAGFVAGTLQAIQSVGKAASNASLRRKFKEEVAAQTRARHLRVAELAADPARAKYAPFVERGESWSDEQIAYHQNREITVTCTHLQPIERAMRDAGIDVRWVRETSVAAQCRVDFSKLQRAFHSPPTVSYAEFYRGDRDYDEYPTAYLICDIHKSIIHTLHPEEGGAKDAPWFPTVES